MKMKISSSFRITNEALLILLLFFIIFLPPLLKISMPYIVTVSIFVFIALSELQKRFLFIHGNYGLYLLSSFFPFIFFVLFQVSLNVLFSATDKEVSEYIYNIVHIAMSFFYIIIVYMFLRVFLKRCVYTTYVDLTKWIVFAGLLQGIFIFLSLLNDDLHMRFLSFFLDNTYNQEMLNAVYLNRWRAHGLSGYYLDNLAYILSGISLVSVLKGIDEKKPIYFFIGIFIILAALIGARTIIVLAFVGIIVVSAYYTKVTHIVTVFKWIAVVTLSIVVVYYFVTLLSDGVRMWLETGIKAVFSLFSGEEKASAFSEILGNDIVIPDNILFGLGAKPESLGYFDMDGHAIDNGYIQMLWRFGLIGTLFFVFGLFRFYAKIFYSTKKKLLKGIIIVFSFVMGLYFFKYYPLSTYGAHVVYFVLPAVMSAIYKEKEC